MKELKIEYLNIDDITPYENNARTHSKDQVNKIANSIEEFGMNDPIGVWGPKNIIIEGHGRLEACKLLGMNVVPVIRLDELTNEQRKAYTLSHNRTAELAGWDFELMDEELADLAAAGFDMGDFGFQPLSEEEPEAEEDNFDVEEAIPEEPMTKQGQIWKLGRHTLMCGDSTSIKDVESLTQGQEMDLVVTDPPYNVAIQNSQGMKIENDDMGKEAFIQFLTAAFYNLEHSLKPGGAFYVWFASRTHVEFETALNENNLTVRQELIWNKNSLVLSRQDYQWKHEPCLYGWKEGAGHYFTDDRTQTTVIEDQPQEFSKMKKEELVRLLEDIFAEKRSTTIIDEKRPSINDLHPTMKPIKLIARLVKNSSKQGEKVMDLFGGSGSTLMACEQLNRECFTMEYDPKYADVIIKRWEEFTGEKAELIHDVLQ